MKSFLSDLVRHFLIHNDVFKNISIKNIIGLLHYWETWIIIICFYFVFLIGKYLYGFFEKWITNYIDFFKSFFDNWRYKKELEKNELESIYNQFNALPENKKRLIIEQFLTSENEFSQSRLKLIYEKFGIDSHTKSSVFKEMFINFLKEQAL
jgi:hypothetical protein